jgi:hypothetical protein
MAAAWEGRTKERSHIGTPSRDLPKTAYLKRQDKMNIDRAFKFAVESSWDELVLPGESCSIHLEYENRFRLPVNFVEVWKVRNRGYGTLIFRYSVERFDSLSSCLEAPVMHFANSYRSKTLADNLDLILENQHQFSRSSDPSIHGLVQIDLPSDEERKDAAIWSRNICAEFPRQMPVGS